MLVVRTIDAVGPFVEDEVSATRGMVVLRGVAVELLGFKGARPAFFTGEMAG